VVRISRPQGPEKVASTRLSVADDSKKRGRGKSAKKRASGDPSAMASPHPPDVKSGLPQGTGSPLGTGEPGKHGTEWWGAFKIGEGISRPGAIPFQLAPRLYVLSRGKSRQRKADRKGPDVKPYDELPRHLIFRESPLASGEQTRQSWVSEEGGHWAWELVVERVGDALEATLTATRTAAGASKRLVWKNGGGWEAFGSNERSPEPDAVDAPPLVVAVP
jgi:hypothetical protein